MKYVLVLSELTYVPNNCLTVLQLLADKHREELAAVVLLQNFSFDMVLKMVWLYAIGCRGMGGTLFLNMLSLLRDERVALSKQRGIPLLKAKSMNDTAVIAWVQAHGIDCIVNIRTRCIYKEDILQAPRQGCFNIHHGLLPAYRGMYCDIYALHENRPAGISLHKMNRKIDDGQVLFTKIVSKKGEKDFLQYLSRTGEAEAEMVGQLIQLLTKGNSVPKIPASEPATVYTHTPTYAQIKQMQQDGLKL